MVLSKILHTRYPALTRWANFWRASGAGENGGAAMLRPYKIGKKRRESGLKSAPTKPGKQPG